MWTVNYEKIIVFYVILEFLNLKTSHKPYFSPFSSFKVTIFFKIWQSNFMERL